ncbi:MAG: hypothetical protein D6785_12080, partial [Planctomycetota bacterium]
MKKKLVLITERWHPSWGGAEKNLAQMGERFIQKGIEVWILSQNFEKGHNSFQYIPLSIPKKPRSLHALLFAHQAMKKMKELHDAVTMAIARVPHAHIYQPHGGVLQNNLHQAYQLGNPWLRELGKLLSPKIWAFLELERQIYHSPKTQAFVALSQKVKKNMIRYYRLPQTKCPLVYN